jgi:tRNA threonylcarbamoyladenosine biosynthesis protein TsaE
MKTILIRSLEDIDSAAGEFIREMKDARIIAFSGELGAGKTTFIQAICRAMGVTGSVNSPTFSLVNELNTPEGETIYHFDLYRINDPSELFDLGYEEYFYSERLCFIEWPEKASHLIPDEARIVTIKVLPDGTREIGF